MSDCTDVRIVLPCEVIAHVWKQILTVFLSVTLSTQYATSLPENVKQFRAEPRLKFPFLMRSIDQEIAGVGFVLVGARERPEHDTAVNSLPVTWLHQDITQTFLLGWRQVENHSIVDPAVSDICSLTCTSVE